jgi:hypothetical protein
MKARALLKRPLLVRLTLLFALLSALIAVAGTGGALAQAVSLGLSLLVGVTYTGMVIQALCVPGDSDGIGDLWRAIAPVLARLIWVSLAAAVGVAAGLLLLIVPGLILLTIWSVAQPVAVVEHKGVLESLRRSRELVRGNGPRVFLFLLVVGLMALLASIFALLIATPFGTGLLGAAVASFLVTLVVNPFTAIAPAALYNCLAGKSLEAGPESSEPGEPPEFTRNGGA